MKNENLKERTRAFALSVIKLVESLPNDRISNVLGNQLLRSGTSVGANYRSATRAKSPADFVAKMGIVEKEADESAYWTDLLEVSGRLKPVVARPLIKVSGVDNAASASGASGAASYTTLARSRVASSRAMRVVP